MINFSGLAFLDVEFSTKSRILLTVEFSYVLLTLALITDPTLI